MSIQVRPADLRIEHPVLLDLLERNLGIRRDLQRFDWLYRQNPCGTAWAWFVYEQQTRTVIGSASLFPRAMWVNGTVQLCGQVGHFSIDVGYRSLGPALLLQRATFEFVTNGTVAFCYDTPPHDQGMATFQRLGMKESCRMSRYARLLRVDRQLERRVGKLGLVSRVAALGNILLRMRDRRSTVVPGVEIVVHAGLFDEEFSLLDKQVASDGRIRGRRSAEDLNWKYRADPQHTYTILAARHRGELTAFVVYAVEDQDARIVDLFGCAEPSVWLLLLDAVAAEVKRVSRAETLHTLVSDDEMVTAALRHAHFSRREGVIRVVTYAQTGSELNAVLNDKRKWAFRYIDYTA